ncbi:MAG: hypothetical protein MI861_17075, partial [Pirellulales bacterium]|nr:hypothetical protein [Pirellulales bacterium]
AQSYIAQQKILRLRSGCRATLNRPKKVVHGVIRSEWGQYSPAGRPVRGVIEFQLEFSSIANVLMMVWEITAKQQKVLD